MDPAIQSRFCDQVRRYGHELLSFVAQELGFAPAALSITLERIDLPPNEVNWVWFVGSVDTATEQAILRFFQTDAGRRALLANGPDPLEFKLATTLLRLPASQAEHPLHPDLPAHLRAAVTPLPGDQEVIILSGPSPEQYVRGTGGATGWLQTFPHMQFSEVLYLHLRGQLQSTNGYEGVLGAWVVDSGISTVYGHVAAIVGARSVLVSPLTGLTGQTGHAESREAN
ncbi:hypothetical protein N656DRAFT_89167 [Canariomyces notabilis]|uniref:Uncharacterized protein n=1 Tax=Canariomyces notabilis TaxID=2074819 RepID=A0AAN6TDL8_9PEZI|nr:hypothetical protein N656DRAFT_89167 [Canariomyces arenarius]